MGEDNTRQFVKYSFYKLDRRWRLLSGEEKDRGKEQFLSILDEFSDQMLIRTYSTVGIRGDADFLVWKVCDRLEPIQEIGARLLSTGLGHYLDTPYSYLAMTRRSMYTDKHRHQGQEGSRVKIVPTGAKYLFVYPFVKTRDWYALSKSTRQGMMDAHIQTGHRYPSVKINTTYSFGLDDQEFVVAFESDSPSDFLDLVMELRGAETSRYTLRDTPTFTCVSMSPEETLDSLGD
ncbi:MAG: chlorite dismutase family protein [Dehalococcoidia bacterium]